jgi:hypothetical protein
MASRLDGRKTGSFTLLLAEARPIRPRAGWLYLSVVIRDKSGVRSAGPAMTGIVSAGGRGVQPWFECRLFPTVSMGPGREPVDARECGLEAGIVNLLAGLIPPGGHLMIDYENPGQEETFTELSLRVPPPATYLGSLMFRAGCRGAFKDWYFSEGGHEGPRKLQANKSPDAAAARRALRDHRKELAAFIARPLPSDKTQAAIIARAQSRARALLGSTSRK